MTIDILKVNKLQMKLILWNSNWAVEILIDKELLISEKNNNVRKIIFKIFGKIDF